MTNRTIAKAAFVWTLAVTPSAHAAPQLDARLLLAPGSYIGVGVMDVTDQAAREIGLVDPHGVEISSIADGGPAEQAGLQPGDIVLTYRGERVNGYEHFARLVRETPSGRTVELGIVREGARQSLQVEIGRRATHASVKRTIEAVKGHIGEVLPGDWHFRSSLDFPKVRMNVSNRRLGIEMESLDGQLAAFFGVERGVLLRSVRDGSTAAAAGLRAGDVIVSVDGRAVHDADQVGRAMSQSDSQTLALEIVRDREKTSLRMEWRSQPIPLRGRPVSVPR